MNIMDYLKTALGSMITAAAFGLFIVPMNFATAGVTGMSKLINVVLEMPLYQVVMGVNILLFTLGTIVLGKNFAAKTVVAAFTFPFALRFFQGIHLFDESFPYPIPMALVAGIVLGLGGGLIIRANGSGCGTDVIVLIINKFKPISVGIAMNALDIGIMLVQAADLPLVKTVSGVIVCVVCAPVMNLVIGWKREERSGMGPVTENL